MVGRGCCFERKVGVQPIGPIDTNLHGCCRRALWVATMIQDTCNCDLNNGLLKYRWLFIRAKYQDFKKKIKTKILHRTNLNEQSRGVDDTTKQVALYQGDPVKFEGRLEWLFSLFSAGIVVVTAIWILADGPKV